MSLYNHKNYLYHFHQESVIEIPADLLDIFLKNLYLDDLQALIQKESPYTDFSMSYNITSIFNARSNNFQDVINRTQPIFENISINSPADLFEHKVKGDAFHAFLWKLELTSQIISGYGRIHLVVKEKSIQSINIDFNSKTWKFQINFTKIEINECDQ